MNLKLIIVVSIASILFAACQSTTIETSTVEMSTDSMIDTVLSSVSADSSEFSACAEKPDGYSESNVMCTMQWDPVCSISRNGSMEIKGNDCQACASIESLGFIPAEYCPEG
jgi:hypothetical protein